jgi:hypothetical protein
MRPLAWPQFAGLPEGGRLASKIHLLQLMDGLNTRFLLLLSATRAQNDLTELTTC